MKINLNWKNNFNYYNQNFLKKILYIKLHSDDEHHKYPLKWQNESNDCIYKLYEIYLLIQVNNLESTNSHQMF